MIGPNRLTLETINAEIKRRGGKEVLVRGYHKGVYFYFINLGPQGVPGNSLPYRKLSQIPLERWMGELELERENHQ